MVNDQNSQAFSEAFIDAVLKRLSLKHRDGLRRLSVPSTPNREGSLDQFLDRLFARAPHEFRASRTPEQIAEVVAGCLDTIEGMTNSPHRSELQLKQDHDDLYLFTALDDRPFIVSSIAERLSDAGVRINAFLHPIFSLQGKLVALSYIDIDPGCRAALESIMPQLQGITEILKAVVMDFGVMSKFLASAAKTMSSDAAAKPVTVDFGTIAPHEISEFLSWLVDGRFFILGTRTLKASAENCEDSTGQEAGLWRVSGPYRDAILHESIEDLQALNQRALDLSIRKLRSSSAVHRPATLLHILLRSPSNRDTVLSICGYLTSRAWTQESQDIPLLRQKLARILSEDTALPDSHDYKYMVEVVDQMPTDEALCASVEDLHACIKLALGVFSRQVTRSHTSIDELRRRAFTMVVLPPERYGAHVRDNIQKGIEQAFNAPLDSSEVHLDSSKRRQLRLYISTPLPGSYKESLPSESLQLTVMRSTLTWEDRLQEMLGEDRGDLSISPLGLFPEEYQVATDPAEAISDLRTLSRISHHAPVGISLFSPNGGAEIPVVSLFSLDSEISISSATPVLENIGLEIRSAHSYSCSLSSGIVHLLKLATRPYDGEALDPQFFNDIVSPGLEQVVRGEAQNDVLNLLLRKASLSIRQITLLRAYCALLWQVNKMTTKRSMWESLAFSPEVAASLCRTFDVKFNPTRTLSIDERKAALKREDAILTEALRRVPDINRDRVLKAITSLVKSTVRTNFFTETDTLAFKIRSQEVEVMPHPRPLFEIFVFSQRIEGTHLRSSKVARGGIRWSERLDDYRSEVLGLMKTQKIKNVIIVPSGAKGGFIMKTPPKDGESMAAAVENSYREYISSLLTLADNNRNGSVIHPANTVIYDEPDPYFVVAADKGTATFSDVANSIAQRDFDFWLGDAFASGGSAGYDHKKYGITAKGAWECTCRHFRDLGIDYENSAFTVVGIGDMSGDVFGNGLLLSRKMALIGAFNHKHVFIDPTPNTERSYEERVRLFNLPRSQWSDYSTELISKGGGVFNRFDKEISLTPEIRAALSLTDETPNVVDGETLVSLILQAQVDLLWNGGIGTYVKGRSESHSDVNDGANDRVRINAEQLRARVVTEGGNLGLTQRARVEFSLSGGRINTDAIDNSGGVDLSDHEVNLKLLLAPLVESGDLTTPDRNTLLKEIDTEVVEDVLHHNSDQALMLSISQLRSQTTMEQYRILIRSMNQLGYLDRVRDNLPEEAELDQRTQNKLGLCRPELALCSAAVKMWIKEELKGSALCQDENLTSLLLSYFPKKIQTAHRSSVLSHPLRTDIISSEVVNSILPVVGISHIHSVVSMRGSNTATVMKCLLAADRILNTDNLRAGLRRLDTPTSCSQFTQLWLDMGIALREAADWLLHHHGSSLSLGEMISLYSAAFDTLTQHSTQVFSGEELTRFERRIEQYQQLGASRDEAVLFSLYRRILPVLEVLWCAREFNKDVQIVASVFSHVFDDLGVNTVFKFEATIEASNKWEQELVSGSYQEIRRNISLITGQLLTKSIVSPQAVTDALRRAQGFEAIRATMSDINETAKLRRPFQIAVLPVISRQLRLLRV